MALKISEIPTTLSAITNETLVEVSEKVDTTYTTKKFNLKQLVEDQIVDGVTNKAPSQNAVYDALAAKVVGPANSIDGELTVFNGTTGKIIKGAGFKPRSPLNSPITVTVGSGGDFPTINAALAHVVSTYYPIYLSTGTVPRVTIQLLSGFVMNKQVLVESLNLSWITITGVDAETVINRSALTTNWGIGYPAFGVMNGGFLPIIGQLFNMDTSGTASNRHGILAFSNSRAIVLNGCGVKNAGSYGIYAVRSSTINAHSADASGAGTYGIYATSGSLISAFGATGTLNQAKNTLTANCIIFQ